MVRGRSNLVDRLHEYEGLTITPVRSCYTSAKTSVKKRPPGGTRAVSHLYTKLGGGIMSGGPSPETHAPAATPHDTSAEALAASKNGSTEQ